MGEKRITIPSREKSALRDLKENVNGAEFNLLEVLATNVLSGVPIEDDFQAVANIVMAKAFLIGKLPAQRRGRPTAPLNSIGWEVAYLYYSLRDRGQSYAQAVSEVSARFHKEERHIMRLVEAHKYEIGGDDPVARKHHRDWWTLRTKMHEDQSADGKKSYLDFALEVMGEAVANKPEPIEVFDAMLHQLLIKVPTDIK